MEFDANATPTPVIWCSHLIQLGYQVNRGRSYHKTEQYWRFTVSASISPGTYNSFWHSLTKLHDWQFHCSIESSFLFFLFSIPQFHWRHCFSIVFGRYLTSNANLQPKRPVMLDQWINPGICSLIVFPWYYNHMRKFILVYVKLFDLESEDQSNLLSQLFQICNNHARVFSPAFPSEKT